MALVPSSAPCRGRQPSASAAFSAAAVSGPTLPSTARPFASWKATTAASVCSPNVPSAAPGLYPAAVRASWRSPTSAGSFSPDLELRPLGKREPLGGAGRGLGGRRRRGLRGRGLRGRGRGRGGRRRRLGLGRRGRRHRLGDGRRRLVAATAEKHHRDRGDDPDDRHEHEPRDGTPPPEVGPTGGRGSGRGRSFSGTIVLGDEQLPRVRWDGPAPAGRELRRAPVVVRDVTEPVVDGRLVSLRSGRVGRRAAGTCPVHVMNATPCPGAHGARRLSQVRVER